MEDLKESSQSPEVTNENNSLEEENKQSSEQQDVQEVNKTEDVNKSQEPRPPSAQSMASQSPKQEAHNSDGWSSWGGWWSSASSVVSQASSIVNKSVEEYVKPTVATISQTTSHMVHELVDDDEEERKESDQEESSQSEGQNEDNSPDFFAVVDKGFTYIGDSVDYLGNYLNEGLHKVATNVRASDLQHKAAGLASKAKEVAVSTTEKGRHLGEQLANQSVDALEAVGKTALGYLTVAESDPNSDKKRLRPIFYHPRLTPEEEKKFEETLNRDYFDESHGTAHLQALENLSIECTLKMQKVEPKLTPAQRDELNAMIMKIKELFKESDEDDAALNVEIPDITLNEPATKHQATLDIVTKEAHDRAVEFSNKFKEEIKELNPGSSEESILTSVDICHLTTSYLDKIVLESAQTLSKLSSASVEQLLKTVESFLIDVDMSDSPLSAEETMKKATFVFGISQLMIEELTSVSNDFVDCVKGIGEESVAIFDQLANKDEQEKTESQQCKEDVTNKMNLHMNHIYLDSSNAISNIQDCKKFLFPICKSLLLDTIDKSPRDVQKGEDKQANEETSEVETKEPAAEETSN